jgi:hypothetical protein
MSDVAHKDARRFAPPPLPRQFILPFRAEDEGVFELQPMTRNEIEDLQRLIRQREKVLKDAATQKSAELIADFENQMGQEYRFDQDEVWDAAVKAVAPAVAKAQEQVKARCREVGIPDRFAPSINLVWANRGYDNLIEKRKNELRRMATTAIAAQERKAKVQIGLSCLDAQTQLAVSGLTSDAARGFIEALPRIDDLMPRLSFAEVAGEAKPPIVEQLLSSNALRQQRHRERQKALRNASEPLQVADVTGGNGAKKSPSASQG